MDNDSETKRLIVQRLEQVIIDKRAEIEKAQEVIAKAERFIKKFTTKKERNGMDNSRK